MREDQFLRQRLQKEIPIEISPVLRDLITVIRFFKERGIKYQFVDMKEKGLSKGEFNSVCQAVGGYEKLIDQECKDKDLLALITYLAEEDKAEKILENQKMIKTPIVRNGKQATVGYRPDIWKNWK